MRKLVVVSLSALVAAAAFAPAAQAKKHHRAPVAAAAVVPANPRMDANGEFYATPVQAGDPSAVLLAPVLAPVGAANTVVAGVTDPILGPGGLPGLDILAAPLK